ncbi:hypothetical protein CLI86_02990 [Tannerella forsythia]|uniref:Uncharacterized protein n=1 Tax=Tannerella forsythia TaxID=28112 RepID=A0A2A6EA67_TANFO|nr:hypothetical protein CLI86_02990 [Tannerella forsythia]
MNGPWLFSKYMIRRVPRITINHRQLTINLSFRAKRRISFLSPARFLTASGIDRGGYLRPFALFAPFAFGQIRVRINPAPHKKGANTRFAPTRHTERCLLMADR